MTWGVKVENVGKRVILKSELADGISLSGTTTLLLSISSGTVVSARKGNDDVTPVFLVCFKRHQVTARAENVYLFASFGEGFGH
jgi:hypothetical protein